VWLARTGEGKNLVHTRWYDDNDNEDDDANTDAHSHLHILPPHLLPDTVRAAPEALRRDGKVVGLILESIETFTSLRDLVDVLAHHIDGVVDLLEEIKLANDGN
jgi:hypothetical protein